MAPFERLTPTGRGCDRVADHLSEYLDGELDASEAEAVADHLRRCAACARLALELAATIAAVHLLGPRSTRAPDGARCALHPAPPGPC
jgi:anti-sigma factor RsiW